MKGQKRILISRPDRIGDVVSSTAIPVELKRTFPNCFVAVFVRPANKDIYLNNPHVDKIILFNEDEVLTFAKFWKIVKELRLYKFTHALSLLPRAKTAYLFFFAGIPFRVGVGHRLYQLLTFSKYVVRNKKVPIRHEADYSMDLARKIGVVSDNINYQIYLSKSEREKIIEKKRKFLLHKKFLVGIHSTSISGPNWDPSEYRKLIDKLSTHNQIQIIVTDYSIPSEICNIENVIYSNDQSIRELIITLGTLDLFISCATGPMHLCAALNIKTVSLFCRNLPGLTTDSWKPLGNDSVIVNPEHAYCKRNCTLNKDDCNFSGAEGVNADDIYKIIVGMLNL